MATEKWNNPGENWCSLCVAFSPFILNVPTLNTTTRSWQSQKILNSTIATNVSQAHADSLLSETKQDCLPSADQFCLLFVFTGAAHACLTG